MFRRIVTSAGPLSLGATAVMVADASKKPTEENTQYKRKPSDLPLYAPLHAQNKKSEKSDHMPQSALRTSMESGISVVRKEVFGACDAIATQKRALDDTIDKGKEQTKFIIDYLNEPANTMPRVGAIAVGGLAGFIFALRGGFIRRVLFTGAGATGIASICYPKEAEVYAQHGLVEAKKYANIAYNFAYGVKPGDDVNAPNWPKVPTNFAELSESLSDIAKSAKDAVFSSKK